MYTRSLYIYRFFYVFHILKINHIFAKIQQKTENEGRMMKNL